MPLRPEDQEGWTRHAEEQMAWQPYADEPLLAHALARREWRTALDFGCGTGLWRDHFRSGRYVGVDQNPDMIQGATVRYPNDEWLQFSTLPLPFADAEFDVIYTSWVLQHIKDSDKPPVLMEIRRLLAQRGMFVAREVTFGPWNIDFNLSPNLEEDGYSHTMRGWQELVEPFGFLLTSQDKDRFGTAVHVFAAT